jgi:phosphonate transport system permease protein
MMGRKNETTIPLSPLSSKLKALAITIGVAATFTLSTSFLRLDMAKFLGRMQNAQAVLRRFMVIDFSIAGKAVLEMLSSLAIALAALAIGFIISLGLAFLAADNTSPFKPLTAFIKGAFAVIRAVPALVWMLMVVASIGFGNTAGMFGLLFPTCGYLVKSFIVSIEDQGTGTIEAMKAVGANWFDITLKGVFPGAFTQIMAWSALRMEFNVAESLNLGMLGVSGIGVLLMRTLVRYQYGSITMILFVILATMLIIEFSVNRINKRLRGGN